MSVSVPMNRNDYDESIIHKILKSCQLNIEDIDPFQTNDRIHDYLLDERLLLRLSMTTLDETEKLLRLKSISGVQKVHFHGVIQHENKEVHYVMMDFFEGDTLYDVIPFLTDEDAKHIGSDIAKSLNELHQINGETYDIGHYIPTIPKHDGSWKSGHIKYISYLKKEISDFQLDLEKHKVIKQAFDYMEEHIDSLEVEEGPVLLHNDLHPKNIIINQHQFVGFIDWECSQFGSYDFDYVNLIHWCLFPPEKDKSFELLLRTVLMSDKQLLKIPKIAERFTIYQLEHEINQMIWHKCNNSEERINRISKWLNGAICHLFERLDILDAQSE